jgi:hypothetical protein
MNFFSRILHRYKLDDAMSAEVRYCVDELTLSASSMSLAGWLFHPTCELENITLRDNRGGRHVLQWQPSPDVALEYGAQASHSRFRASIDFPFMPEPKTCKLEATAKGTKRLVQVQLDVSVDPYHRLFQNFLRNVNGLQQPSVLEIGSRARSGNVYSTCLDSQVVYTGMDIVAGENVDMVGDAHELSRLFTPGKFDAIFTISVFEHLAMPWKVALECNKVLKVGGLMFIGTHQTWPVHDAPWDFWRFSSSAWTALFNTDTGFRVVEAVMGLPCSVMPLGTSDPPLLGLIGEPAYLGSGVIVEKIGETSLEWPVETKTVVEGLYPH